MKFTNLVTTYTLTCGACPTQYEGTLHDGRCFYFRYRGGIASLGIGDSAAAAVADPNTVEDRIGDYLDGSMTEPEFREVMVRLAAEHWSLAGEVTS